MQQRHLGGAALPVAHDDHRLLARHTVRPARSTQRTTCFLRHNVARCRLVESALGP